MDVAVYEIKYYYINMLIENVAREKCKEEKTLETEIMVNSPMTIEMPIKQQ